MKEKIIQEYQDSLLNIYHQSFLKNCTYDYVVVLKEGEEFIKDNILFVNYHDFYNKHDFQMIIPPIRKEKKLLTYQNGLDLLKRVHYGTLSITNDFPYCTGLNHIVYKNEIYFHCGYTGYKLNGLNHIACYHVIEDLGIHAEAFTNNHQSVTVYGVLKEVKENKKAILEAFLQQLTPGFSKVLNENAIKHTMIMKLTIDHMSVKKHFH